MRFQSGESDVISRITPKDYAVLQRDSGASWICVTGCRALARIWLPFFNLNDSVSPKAVWRQLAFRRAVSAAMDRDAIVRLVYQGYADPLASALGAGNKAWIAAKFRRHSIRCACPGVPDGRWVQVEPRRRVAGSRRKECSILDRRQPPAIRNACRSQP